MFCYVNAIENITWKGMGTEMNGEWRKQFCKVKAEIYTIENLPFYKLH